MKFRKKPVVIEAIQWDGTYKGMVEINIYFKNIVTASACYHQANNTVSDWRIITLEGGHIVSKGDFVIRGIAGEYYPCKPDIFEKTYEKVEESNVSSQEPDESEFKLLLMLKSEFREIDKLSFKEAHDRTEDLLNHFSIKRKSVGEPLVQNKSNQ